MTTSTLLVLLLAIFTVVSLAVSVYTTRLVRSGSDFMVSGRQLGWIATGFALVGIAFSGAYVPLQVQLGYQFGWGGYWLYLTWVLALWFWIPIILKFWRRMGAYSQAEWVEYNFGLSVRAILALAWSFVVILATAVQLVGMGVTIGGTLGISAAVATILFGIVVVLYMAVGGMWAVVAVDVFQALWVAFSLGLAVPLVLVLAGGGEALSLAGLPDGMLGLPFGTLPLAGLAFPALFSMATLHLVLLSMGHYQVRAASIRSERDIAKAWFFGGALVLLVGIPLNWMGMYMRATAPDIEPASALGVLLSQVPPLVAAFALVGIMAATMSTVSGVLIAGSNSLVRDLVERLMGFSAGTATLRNRLAMLGLGGAAVIVAVASPSGIAKYFILFTAIAAHIIAIHLDTAYVHKATKEGALVSLIVGLAFAFYWQVLSDRDATIGTQNIAIPLAFVTLYSVSFIARLTGPWWSEERWGSGARDRAITRDDDLKREVLKLVNAGRGTLADLTDSVEGLLASGRKSFAVQSISVSEVARYLDRLVHRGLVRALGRTGRGVVTYETTDSGVEWLRQQEEGVAEASPADELDANARMVLDAAVNGEDAHVRTISEKTGLSTGEVVPIFNQLTRAGYAQAHGFLRFEIKPTDRGRELLAET